VNIETRKISSSGYFRDTSKLFQPAERRVLSGGVSVIIPFRGQDRLDNLRSCLQFLLYQSAMPLEVIVVEESPEMILHKFPIASKTTKVVHVKGGDRFNKSIAVNTGAIIAKYQALSIHDVDLILPNNYFEEVAKSLYNDNESCFLLKEIYYMAHRPMPNRIMISNNHKRSDYFNGGSVNICKETFMRIGGMNEKFSGYGHEDCEFWTRVQALTKLNEDRKYAALHMKHKRPTSWSENTALYESIVIQPMEDRLAELQIDLKIRQNATIL